MKKEYRKINWYRETKDKIRQEDKLGHIERERERERERAMEKYIK